MRRRGQEAAPHYAKSEAAWQSSDFAASDRMIPFQGSIVPPLVSATAVHTATARTGWPAAECLVRRARPAAADASDRAFWLSPWSGTAPELPEGDGLVDGVGVVPWELAWATAVWRSALRVYGRAWTAEGSFSHKKFEGPGRRLFVSYRKSEQLLENLINVWTNSDKIWKIQYLFFFFTCSF